MSEPILVLGMHRSGTSAVAGVLTKLGGRPPKHLMEAHPENPRGFFESLPTMALNDELLASAGSSWDDWRKFNPSWFASAEAEVFRRRAGELLRAEFDDSPLPVLKDPRICRFAPFWLDVLEQADAKPRVLIPVRSPLEVARSLELNRKMPLAKGLLLWLRHVLDAEADSRNVARSIFTWEQFLFDWQATAEKIGAEAGLAWPRLSDRAAREIEQFIEHELVHQRIEPAAFARHSKIHEWTLAAYQALLELARNPFSNSAIETLNEIRRLFDLSCAMFGPLMAGYEANVEQFEARLEQFSKEKSELQTQASFLSGELLRLGAEADGLAARLVVQDGELAAVRAALEDAKAALAEASRQTAASAAERDALLAEAQAHAAELAEEAGRRGYLLEQIEKLEAGRRAARDEADALSARLGEAEARSVELMRALASADQERVDAAARIAELQVEVASVSAERRQHIEALQRAKKEAIEREGALQAALVASEKQAQERIGLLNKRMIEAQARLAKAAQRGVRPGWKRFLPRMRRDKEAELLLASGLFDREWYESQYPQAVEAGRAPVEHFLQEGYLSGCQPNPLFDTYWYLDRYEDVLLSGQNPVIHYIKHGAKEGRDPGPDFRTGFYIATNADVRNSGVNPLAHYLRHGRYEGRPAIPRF